MSKRNDARKDSRKEAARAVRERLAAEQRRRRQLLTSIGVIALLLIAGATSWFIYSSQQPSDYTAPKNTYRNDVGFVYGEGPKLLEVYFDYQCPACRSFELGVQDQATNTSVPGMMDRLAPVLAARKAKVVYYPVAILDYTSPNEYSTRAAAASACAADENKIHDFTRVLLTNQVEEGTTGPTDNELIDYGKSVGLEDSFAKCVKDGKYLDWVKHATNNFEERGLSGTPSIFVDGKRVEQKDKESLFGFIDRIMAMIDPEAAASNSPSGSAEPSDAASNSPSGSDTPAPAPS